MIESPCLGVCVLLDGKCVGCHRTDKEISNWLFYTDKERMKITKRCLKVIENENRGKSG